MSRSWTERLREGFMPAMSAGVTIGRDYLGCARVVREGGTWRVQALEETPLDVPLFTGAPSPQTAAGLIGALKRMRESFPARYLPVHVSLPDAAVRIATFELQELPKTRAAQLGFVEFRFDREAGMAPGVFACQPLGREDDKHLLLGLAADKTWQQWVAATLAQAGVVAWSMSANVCRQFNRFHEQLARTSGALLVLSPDTWSLCLWDAAGRVRYVRARWRSDGEDYADIAVDVERSILAYVNARAGNAIARVYLAAGADAGSMAAALNARLREPCEPLSGEAELVFDGTARRDAKSAPASLAAALQQ